MVQEKPKIEISTNENVFQQFEDISPNRNVGDCCEIAKDTWVKTVEKLITGVNNHRKGEINSILNPSNLDCRNFYNLLKELRLLDAGSDAIFSINKILGRYFRLEKVTTSLLSNIASIGKSAGAEALTSWVNCSSMKEDEPDPLWQQQLRRDY